MIKPLKTRQICFFYVAILPVVKFFMMPSSVSLIAGEDLWISVLINCLLDFTAIATVYFCLKNQDGDFFTLSEKLFGKAFAKTVAAIYIVFFLLKTVMPLNETKDYVEMTLYITSPNIFTFMPVFALIVFVCMHHLRVIGRIADGVLIVALIGYAFMFALALSDTDFGALLPVGAHGAKNILYGAYVSEPWFNDCAYFLFFTGQFVKSKKDGLKILASFAVSAAIVVFFCILFYGTFTSVAFRQRFALTEISKYTTTINNTERFDYIPIFAMLFTAVFSLAMPFYFATDLFVRLIPVKRTVASVIVCVPLIVLLLFFEEYFATIENFITQIASGFFLFFGTVFPALLAIIMKICLKKEKKIEIQRS